MTIQENLPLSTLTTMRLGGKASFVITLESPTDIPQAFDFIHKNHLPHFILGTGSNVIGRDQGYPGVILINKLKGIKTLKKTASTITIEGQAGEILDDFIKYTVDLGYSGLEAMSAIPGTLGAAPIQNVGAYGQDISQTIQSVQAYDTHTSQITTIPAKDLHLGYRRSIFNHGPTAGRYLITSVTVQLHATHLTPPFYTSLQSYIDTHHVTDFSPASIRSMVTKIRATKLPDPTKIASAGSFFKNVYLPPAAAKQAAAKGIPVWEGGKIPAGWLIENAGLKGHTFHGFQVSEKAALILINLSAKHYSDLIKARTAIQQAVHKKFGFALEQEPVEISP